MVQREKGISDKNTPTKYYRVRKSWADKASQIGAFCLLRNAINLAQMNEGYCVFLDGVQIWPEKKDSPSKK